MIKQGLFAAALLAVTAGCASQDAHLAPIASEQAVRYQLGPGDDIRIAVFGFDALSNSYVVSDAGTISMPLLSTVEVDGLTTADLEATITGLMRAKHLAPNPSVSVQVQKYRPFFILGEVQNPGQYPYVPGMSVLTAVSIAGGFTFRAETKHASITRSIGQQVTRGKAVKQTLVLPGDTVEVPEAWF